MEQFPLFRVTLMHYVLENRRENREALSIRAGRRVMNKWRLRFDVSLPSAACALRLRDDR